MCDGCTSKLLRDYTVIWLEGTFRGHPVQPPVKVG